MDRMPNAADLSPAGFSSLLLVAREFMGKTSRRQTKLGWHGSV
jgi:hypothetical protein